jgi:hypothetical protein
LRLGASDRRPSARSARRPSCLLAPSQRKIEWVELPAPPPRWCTLGPSRLRARPARLRLRGSTTPAGWSCSFAGAGHRPPFRTGAPGGSPTSRSFRRLWFGGRSGRVFPGHLGGLFGLPALVRGLLFGELLALELLVDRLALTLAAGHFVVGRVDVDVPAHDRDRSKARATRESQDGRQRVLRTC